MRLMRVRAITKKEFLQIFRDPLSLAMAFLMPALLLFIFGYAITLDVDRITTVVHDMDKTSLSRELVRQFVSSGYFTVVGQAKRPGDIDQYLDTGRARVAIAIPAGFTRKVESGKEVQLQVIVDGSDSNTATIALGYIDGLSERFARTLGGTGAVPLIDPRIRVWYNPELKSKNFIIPGLVAVIMAVIAALLTSLTVAREWERGTMEQLISTPVKVPELIIGKLIPYFAIGFVDVMLSVVLGVFLFGVPLKGNVLLLMALSSVFLFGALSLGILISIVAKSQLMASQVAIVVSYLPAFLLSGFMFSITNMPTPLQVMSHIIPARYFVTILKDIFLKGNPFTFLVFEASLLAVFGLAVFAIANWKFRKRIE